MVWVEMLFLEGTGRKTRLQYAQDSSASTTSYGKEMEMSLTANNSMGPRTGMQRY